MNLRGRSGLKDAFLISCACRIQRFHELPGTNSLPGCWSSRWGHLTLTTWSFHFHPDNHLLVLPSIPTFEFGFIFSFSFFQRISQWPSSGTSPTIGFFNRILHMFFLRSLHYFRGLNWISPFNPLAFEQQQSAVEHPNNHHFNIL